MTTKEETKGRTKEETKKVVLVIQGYMKIIMPLDAAYHLFKLADSIELLEDKYDNVASKSYQIVRPADTGYFRIESLDPHNYAVAKMTYAAQLTKGETK